MVPDTGGYVMEPRFCYHADESYTNEDGDYLLVRFEENTPGYLVVSPYSDLEEAQATARAFNERMNISDEDALHIRMSAIAANRGGQVFDAFLRVQFSVPEDTDDEHAQDLLVASIHDVGTVKVSKVDLMLMNRLVSE